MSDGVLYRNTGYRGTLIICLFNHPVNNLTGNKGSRSIVNQNQSVTYFFKAGINRILTLLSAAYNRLCLVEAAAKVLAILQIFLRRCDNYPVYDRMVLKRLDGHFQNRLITYFQKLLWQVAAEAASLPCCSHDYRYFFSVKHWRIPT